MRWLVALGVAVVTVGCCDDEGPTPLPTPTPTPMGVAEATAFENLPLVQSLERASGNNTRLVAVSARVEESGRVTPGGTWYYTFEEPSRPSVVTQWRVSSQGAISSETYGSCGFENSVDMAPLLGLDSDAVVALALDYGVRPLLDGLSEPKSLSISYISGLVRVKVHAPDCNPIYNGFEMDPTSGALLWADTRCTGPPQRPCVAPGVF